MTAPDRDAVEGQGARAALGRLWRSFVELRIARRRLREAKRRLNKTIMAAVAAEMIRAEEMCRLRQLVLDLASDLEAELLARYAPDGNIHPALAVDFDNDMEIVFRAREFVGGKA